ncbi:anti-phage dCTP deaminase [Sulfitobacter sp. SH24]|uniref:anti-phage dCTP deaminase n=1 Tax=Sulfitobacter sp. SH24 TaxID=3421173 RepID=UPI003F5024F9
MNVKAAEAPRKFPEITGTGQSILEKHHSKELFIAIVGPAGSGAGTAAKLLQAFFEDDGYSAVVIKASEIIREVSLAFELAVPPIDGRKSVESITTMQNRGDDLRRGNYPGGKEDHAAIARFLLRRVSTERARMQGRDASSAGDVAPDGQKRVYIIDSLRHPAEANLLRQVYQDSFALIGVVCDPHVREKRIRENFFDRAERGSDMSKQLVKSFLERDEDAPEKFGQHVSDTFHEADFFVDNSQDGNETLTITGMNDHLKRFVSLISQKSIVRPSISETAMHHARSAQMRSACLSRQVGAALVDRNGNIVATGTNEVPKAGGGVYGEGFDQEHSHDHRCAFRGKPFCSSNHEQNEIIRELIGQFPGLVGEGGVDEALRKIRKTRLGGLLEFSRAVHAEMDAILSASVVGVSPKGCRLYVTTYPCHYCARHIVAAGIDEVQFIEPYPKSKATELHDDAITTQVRNWEPPSAVRTVNDGPLRGAEAEETGEPSQLKVLFRPFVGVAPRMYRRVFLKDRDYKDKITGERVTGRPAWGGPHDSYKVSYVELERELGLEAENG